MNWILSFLAGMFLANAVPHFVHGISGERFPTPFAHPPGKGLSSPTINVVWALFNLGCGYLFLRARGVNVIAFSIGVAAISLFASVRFASKHDQ